MPDDSTQEINRETEKLYLYTWNKTFKTWLQNMLLDIKLSKKLPAQATIYV